MKVRYQADADLNQKIVAAVLRLEPTIDFHTSHAASLEGVEDREVLRIAARDGRVLITHDKATMPDAFGEFVQSSESPGVIVISRGYKLADVAEELVLIWATSESEEWVNRIVYIPL
jgi:predicted nuclease of predicted toxin-antitoxin system